MDYLRTRKSLVSIFTLVLMLLFRLPKTTHSHLHFQKHQVPHSASACQGTLYPQLCVSTLTSLPDITSKSAPQIISSLINHTLYELQSSFTNCSGLLTNLTNLENRALDDCLKLFDDTVDDLNTTIAALSNTKIGSTSYHDLQTLLSAAMTNLYTCLDGFAYTQGNLRHQIQDRLLQISRLLSNSLAMLNKISNSNDLLFPEYGNMKNGFPLWVSSKERKLLEANVNETRFHFVVAKDGTGNFTTIGEAVAAAPNSSTTRMVIHIKAGAYMENVEVMRKKRNLMLVGDGIGKTIVKASRNVIDGWTTFQSATVAVVGGGFIAKGISFENSAGPSKHQAVALRNSADLSAFYKCSFVGYQDTLYVHSLRQFYRQCDIYGTIDFIFGNAAAVFQNCNLYARKPNQNQKNVFTAQGREDPNQNTGISFLNCKIGAASDLVPFKSSFRTYLGRPWKPYSRTVYMKSYMEDVVEAAGWLEWNGTLGLDTLYYGEYMNLGPGSNTSGRVRWPGYRLINSTEATHFTARQFIQGNEWLNSTAIPFFLNLTG